MRDCSFFGHRLARQRHNASWLTCARQPFGLDFVHRREKSRSLTSFPPTHKEGRCCSRQRPSLQSPTCFSHQSLCQIWEVWNAMNSTSKEAPTVLLQDDDDDSSSSSSSTDESSPHTCAGLFVSTDKPLPMAARRTIPLPRVMTTMRWRRSHRDPNRTGTMVRRFGSSIHFRPPEGEGNPISSEANDRGQFIKPRRPAAPQRATSMF